MSKRRVLGLAGVAFPWGLAFVVLLSWVRCGPDPDGAAPGRMLSSLETGPTVWGPPPGEDDGLAFGTPVAIADDGATWLVLWTEWGNTRGARLDRDLTVLDPAPGLLLQPDPYYLSHALDPAAVARVPGTFFLFARGALVLLGDEGPPTVALSLPEPYFPSAVGRDDRALIVDGSRWWAVSTTGEVLWEVQSDVFGTPVATSGGFLVGWSDAGRALVRTVAPDGTLGDPVVVAEDGTLLGLAAGPAGVVAWVDGDPPRLERLDEATGAPTGAATSDFGDADALLALPDGWLLRSGAQGWRVDEALNVTPVELPYRLGSAYAYDADAEAWLEVSAPEGGYVRVGFAAEEPAAFTVVTRGIESLRVRAVGTGPGGRLVVQEELSKAGDPDPRPTQAWRIGPEGARVDETPLDLGPTPRLVTSGAIEAAVAGSSGPWLVALGDLGSVRLFEIGIDGPAAARGTLDCGAATPDYPASPAAAELEDGWLVACGGDGVRLHRLDGAFSETWAAPQVLADDGTQLAVALAVEDGRAWLAWGAGTQSGPLTVAEVDADTGALLDQRSFEERGRPVGIAVREGRILVSSEYASTVRLLILDGLDDPDPGDVTTSQGRASVGSAPVFVGDEFWFCASSWDELLGVLSGVVCTRVDLDSAEIVDETTVGGDLGAALGAVVGAPDGLVVGHTAWDAENGTFRGAVTVLQVEGTPGDGGSPGDGGDAGADDGGDGGGGIPDAAGEDAGAADAGDAGLSDGGGPADGGDAGTGDAGAGDAGDAGAGDGGPTDAGAADGGTPTGTPVDEGGCGGCAPSGGGEPLALLALLALHAIRRRGSGRAAT